MTTMGSLKKHPTEIKTWILLEKMALYDIFTKIKDGNQSLIIQ